MRLVLIILLSLIPTLTICGFIIGIQYYATPDDFVQYTPWWLLIGCLVVNVVLSIRTLFFRANSLWNALRADYPSEPIPADTWPRSAGLIGTSERGDLSNAISYGLENGLYLQRYRRYLSNTPWVRIPWEKIEQIELIEPDRESMDSADTREKRKTLATLMHAKITLARQRSPLTLLVPWNEQFSRCVPPSIELVRKWSWPFSVL